MRERRQIIDRWQRGDGSVLATLFHVSGSSYRQPGARLLVCKDGSYEGSISGGCLEADLVRKATWLVRDGAAIERYSTIFDDASEVPYGLGCGGVLDVLLEPVDSEEGQALLSAFEDHIGGKERLVVTWLPSTSTTLKRVIVDGGGQILFASSGLSQEEVLKAQRKSSGSTRLTVEGVVCEHLKPPQRLFVFGAGDDAKPLVTMASLLGWNVTVVDGRTHLAAADRFPERHVRVSSSREEILHEVSDHDAAVIMTHSFEQDRDCLIALLSKRPKYLGLLGSRQRSSLLMGDAAGRLGLSIEECCQVVSAPVGLDIGGEGPEDIALAIIAEAQAVCSGKAQTREKLSAHRVQSYLVDVDSERQIFSRCELNTL